jgi:hypothetical protein
MLSLMKGIINFLQINDMQQEKQLIAERIETTYTNEYLSSPPFWISSITVIVLISSAAISYLSSRKSENFRREERKYQLLLQTFYVIKDWDSEAMRKSRHQAWEDFILPKKKKEDVEALSLQRIPFSQIDSEIRFNMIRIVEFFDKIKFLVDNKMINEEQAKEYLEEDYTGWYNNYFRFQLNIENENSFKNAFKKHPLKWLLKEDLNNK